MHLFILFIYLTPCLVRFIQISLLGPFIEQINTLLYIHMTPLDDPDNKLLFVKEFFTYHQVGDHVTQSLKYLTLPFCNCSSSQGCYTLKVLDKM
jgi:hypothetical protein